MEGLVKGDLGNGIRIQHPTAFAFRACEYADERNSVIVGKCVEMLKYLEQELKDDQLASNTSYQLNKVEQTTGRGTHMHPVCEDSSSGDVRTLGIAGGEASGILLEFQLSRTSV